MPVTSRANVLSQIQTAIAGSANAKIRGIVASFSTRNDTDADGNLTPVVVWRLRLGRVVVEKDESATDSDASIRAFFLALFKSLRDEWSKNQ